MNELNGNLSMDWIIYSINGMNEMGFKFKYVNEMDNNYNSMDDK